MYEIRTAPIKLEDGTEILGYQRDIENCNILMVTAGTTGYMGGDSGHGGRTYFSIMDLAGTDIRVKTIGTEGRGGFEVMLGGDSELETMIQALKFITKALEDEAKGVQD